MIKFGPSSPSGLLIAWGLLVAGITWAQDTAKVNPHIVKILYEDNDIRILEVKSNHGDVEDWHSHPAYFAYAITDGKLRITLPDGRSQIVEIRKGENVLLDPVKRHKGRNVGGMQIQILLVELKNTRPMAQKPKEDSPRILAAGGR